MTHIVGSAKNQLPTNQELGDLAFQSNNIKSLGVGDLTASNIQMNVNTTSTAPSLMLDFANVAKNSNYIDPRITKSSITNTTWNSNGVVVKSTTLPRYEILGTGESLGLLCENQSTNTLPYSYGATGWVTSGTGTRTDFQPAPDGTNTALLLNDASTTSQYGNYGASSVVPVTNETWCVSCYIKKQTTASYPFMRFYASTADDIRININTKTGEYLTSAGASSVVVGGGVIDCGNWWRVWVSGYYTAGTPTYGRLYVYPSWNTTLTTGNGSTSAVASNIFWGFQAEKSAFPTSTILTNGSALTRTIDEYKINTLSSFYNPLEGTLFVEFVSRDTLAATAVGFESATGDTDSIRIRVGSTGTLLGQTRVASSDTNLLSSSFSINTNYRVAYAYKANDFGMCANGGTVQTGSSGAIPTVSYMSIGVEHTGTTPVNALDGYIKKIAYYPKRLSNAELVELTK